MHPIVFPLDAWHVAQDDQKAKVLYAEAHPFQVAQRWQQEIATDPTLTKARIAERESLSRARVTQIMNLLSLPMEIREQLLHLPQPLKIRLFSEHRLRTLVAVSDKHSQLRQWQEWLTELLDTHGS